MSGCGTFIQIFHRFFTKTASNTDRNFPRNFLVVYVAQKFKISYSRDVDPSK